MRYQDEYPDEIERMKARKDRMRLEEIRRQEKLRQQQLSGKNITIMDNEQALRTSPSEKKQNNEQTLRTSPSGKKPIKKKKRGKFKIVIIELLLLCILAGGIWYYINMKPDSGYWTVAVFGVDSRDGNLSKGALSDVEMICNINKETGEIQLISVYRDTYVQINSDGTYHKINEAYFKGGYDQALYAINTNLDLKITDYATFNWKAVVNAINILGGVDIDITDKEFEYINSFITETVNSTGIGSYQLDHAGMNHLDGVQAVAYSRLRLMDTDYQRTERQRKVVSLAFDKAKAAGPAKLIELVQAVFPEIKTNIGIDDLLPMAKNVKKYHLGETSGFPFTKGTALIGKKDCVIPLTLESNVIELHKFLYPDDAYSPSSKLKSISKKIASDSGLGEVVDPPAKKETSSGNSSSTQPAPKETPASTINESEESMEESSLSEEELTESEITDETDIDDNTDISDEFSDDNENTKENEETTEFNNLPTVKPAETNPVYGPEGGPGVSGTNETMETETHKPTTPTKEIGPGVN